MPTKSTIYALVVALTLAALSATGAVAFDPQPDPPAKSKYKVLPPSPCTGTRCVTVSPGPCRALTPGSKVTVQPGPCRLLRR
jgi:hypothetical protein